MQLSKSVFDFWVKNGILSKGDIEEIENRVSLFKVPTGVGRLPGRIGSRYGGFTANQWKNWILLYSPVVLKGLLPTNDMGCWLLFVCACRLICKAIVKIDDINSASCNFVEGLKLFMGKSTAHPICIYTSI